MGDRRGCLRREFRVTVGLREGYAPGAPRHDAAEVADLIAAWMAERAGAGMPTISGMVTAGEVIYAAGGPDDGQADREAVAIFAGEVLGGAVQDVPDAEIEAQLETLAHHLGIALKQQQHVTIAYREWSWVLDIVLSKASR